MQTETDPKAIACGARIAQARIAAGHLTASVFARRVLDIDPATLWMYENGKRTPRAEVFVRIAQALNVSVDWLLTGEGQGPASSEAS